MVMLLYQVCRCNDKIDIAILSSLGFLPCTSFFRNIFNGLVFMLIPKRSLYSRTYWMRTTCSHDTFQVGILHPLSTYETIIPATPVLEVICSTECCCILVLLYVCTGQELTRARFVSWSTPSCFIRVEHFASLVGALVAFASIK